MNAIPRLTVGLPVYNGARYLAESLEALLGQTYDDFELVISDNASTDGTPDICRHYEKLDSRIRFFRQSRNIGMAPNHNFVADQGRGELFKWASHDDLYAKELLERCVEALDKHPDAVLAHSPTAFIDRAGVVTKAFEYPLATASGRPPERFASMLFDRGGDDYYGVVREKVLRRALPQNSYHHAERTVVAEIGLHGPFYQVPDWLYFRRQHAEQVELGWPERARPTIHAECATWDPRRANRLRHPAVRLYGEYVLGYVAAIRRAPLSSADRRECYGHLARWVASKAYMGRSELGVPPSPGRADISVDAVVAGREKRAS